MAGQYSHRQFLRRTPNEFLESYFTSKGINLGVDFKGQKIKEAIFQTLINLLEAQQAEIETEFQNINAMACEGGIMALRDEATFHKDDTFAESIDAIDGFHAKAMWAFLEKHEYWRVATMFLHVDNVAASYWKKRNDLPRILASTQPEVISKLAKSISDFFHTKEGRGRNCKVEVYRRNNKDCFFAYPEDFGQSDVEWITNNLQTRSRHPAFEIIFVYCQDEGSLDIYAPKNNKAIPELQKCFVTTILKQTTLEDSTTDKQVYDLAPLADPNFEFQFDPDANIENVVVTRLRLTLKYGPKKRITLEADTKKNQKQFMIYLKRYMCLLTM